ncbi:MAG: ribose-phosphate pyrophosphokinase [Bacillota bacterium]
MARYADGKLKLFTGNANPALARDIVKYLGVELGRAEVGRFSNGEIKVLLNESVRGADAFVVQSICTPVNDSLMELLIMVDALRRASAKRVTAVIPFYGYARQDRKTRGREPITAKLVANLIATARAGRVLTVDLHAGQIQGFFDIPVDHLSAVPLLVDDFRARGLADLVVVAPDLGGVQRARDMADRLDVGFAIIDKRRPEPGVAEVMNIIGRVQGKNVVMIDDMIDTGGTIALGAQVLREKGARAVYACCTHPVLSGPAPQRLAESVLEEVVVTDTIPLSPDQALPKVRVISLAPLLGEAIIRIHEDLSVSKLFE